MKKLFVALLLGCAACWAQIVPVKSAQEIAEYMAAADEQTLVIFDIDEVLIAPADPAFRLHWGHPHFVLVEKLLAEQSKPVMSRVWDMLNLASDAMLVDEAMPQVIEQLQTGQIPTMALTMNRAGQIPARCEEMALIKLAHLMRWGIDFSLSPVHDERVEFHHLSGYYGSPTYLEGVLFASGNKKGAVLVAFLEHAGLEPISVIFVDDRIDNLVSVEEALRQINPNIRYLGLHYTDPSLFEHDLTAEETLERWKPLVQEAHEFVAREALALQ
jgi:hypothetical protein